MNDTKDDTSIKVVKVIIAILILVVAWSIIALSISLVSGPVCQQLGFGHASVNWDLSVVCTEVTRVPLLELIAQ